MNIKEIKEIENNYMMDMVNSEDLKELKKVYFKYAKQLHTDLNNIDRCHMQLLNDYYRKSIDRLNDYNENNDIKDDININYDFDIHIFDDLFEYESKYKIVIELVGSWIWLTLEYPSKKKNPEEHEAFLKFKKDILKDKYNFSWSNNKKKWYLPDTNKKVRYGKKLSMQEIYKLHGREVIKSNNNKKFKAALSN